MSPKLLSNEDRHEVITYAETRYGVNPSVWKNLDLIKRKEGVWLIPKGVWSEEEDHLWESTGLRVLSGKSFPYKITMSFVQTFFPEIMKNKIEVTELEALTFLRRMNIDSEGHKDFQGLTKGYYIFCFEGKPLGIALKTDRELVSQVPKSFAAQLGKNLKLKFGDK